MDFLKKPSARVLGLYFWLLGTFQILSGLLLVLGMLQLKGRAVPVVYYYGLVGGILGAIFGVLFLYCGSRIKFLVGEKPRFPKGLLTVWIICMGLSIELSILLFGFHKQTLSQSLIAIFLYFYFMKAVKRLSTESAESAERKPGECSAT
jgi:hypothetical protein